MIRTEGLTRRFGEVLAVQDLNLVVRRGSIFGFLGPNGAGKTTTIRLLLGLIAPTSGIAEVCGFIPATDGEHVRQRTGALLEHSGVYERLSGEQNLEFYGRVAGIPVRERRERIAYLLRHFGLWDRRQTSAGTWSRGMKQKLAIARAVLHKPELVFLDEPTAGLDPAATAALRDDIANMARETGSTVFLTTHNLAEAERLCDTVGIIVGGKLLACGPPQSLSQRTKSEEFRISGTGVTPSLRDRLMRDPRIVGARIADNELILTVTDDSQLPGVLSLLGEAGMGVSNVRRSGTSLEDIYLAVTQASATNGS